MEFVQQDGGYKSLIRVKGVSFKLPPLITAEKRLQIKAYKQRAVELEHLLTYHRELVQLSHNLLNSRKISKQHIDSSLEHRLAFVKTKHVPLTTEKYPPPSLSKHVFDVTQYNSEGVVLFDDDDSGSIPQVDNNESAVAASGHSPDVFPPPRLLRSNSYVLDAPSPILLERLRQLKEDDITLKKAAVVVFDDDSGYETCKKIEDLAKRHFGGGEKGDVPLENRQSEKDDRTIGDRSLLDYSVEELAMLERVDESSKGEEKTLAILADTLITDTFEEQWSDVATPLEIHHRHELVTKRFSDIDVYEKDKSNLQLLMDFRIYESPTNDKTTPLTNDEVDIDNETIATKLMTTSRCLFDTSTPLLIDFADDHNTTTDTSTDLPPPHRALTTADDPLNVLMSCDDKTRHREHWAATVLTAATRGYLVRRLQRTERVRSLIRTIQDAVTCAVSLHRDDVDSVDEADVELHRRLLSQIWAACYEYHDIFFKLSKRERMAIIAHDRQTQLNKLKRRSSSSAGSLSIQQQQQQSSSSNLSSQSKRSVGGRSKFA